jgi:hypothetical protein
MAANSPTEKLVRFTGLNTIDDPHSVGFKGLTVAENVDIDNDLRKLYRREGYEQVLSAAATGAWIGDGVLLYTTSSGLYVYDGVNAPVLIHTLTAPVSALSGAKINGKTFWSTGFETGVIEGGHSRSLGLRVPLYPACAVSSGGALRQGRYMVAVSFVRDDGQEGGTSRAVLVEVPYDGSAISVTLPVTSDLRVDRIRVYCTETDGQELYLAGAASAGSSVFDIRQPPHTLTRASTQFKGPPPLFDQIVQWQGQVAYSAGEWVYLSEPFNPELVDSLNSVQYDGSNVTMLGALNKVLWVGTEGSIWRQTKDGPEQVAPYGVFPGTWVLVPGSYLGKGEITEPCGMFTSVRGICVAYPNGDFRNVSENRVELNSAVRGTAMLRDKEGQRHYVSVLQS